MRVGILFPHQLFEQNSVALTCDTIYLVEEWLYFRQYTFHKRKIAFHRASMKCYGDYLRTLSIEVRYIDAFDPLADIQTLIPHLQSQGIATFEYMDTTDCWLEQRIKTACNTHGVKATQHPSALFLNSPQEIATYFNGKKRLFQTDFYKHERVRRNILLETDGKPKGGKWTYDDENRLKYPKGNRPPAVHFATPNVYVTEAIAYTHKHFAENYGQLNTSYTYPTTFAESKAWLHTFLRERFSAFGDYEDAIVGGQPILHHSVLTPMLNVGLITPQYVIDETLAYAESHHIPLNSVEGFIRQLMGWREFIRAVYELKGSEERTKNFWGFTKRIPPSFWTGTTGIAPIDSTIKSILETGYCHHIERLMVLGNFMLLCEFDPDEVYRWFMELFIDAYDWVMVPNVYGMSQFADGGMMSTKPYISGSNYLMKMSNYPKGEWQSVWDGLFWRFMHTHRDFFLQQPRLGMLVSSFDKMAEAKQHQHLRNATQFLDTLTS